MNIKNDLTNEEIRDKVVEINKTMNELNCEIGQIDKDILALEKKKNKIARRISYNERYRQFLLVKIK